jgi:hypothetical protein
MQIFSANVRINDRGPAPGGGRLQFRGRVRSAGGCAQERCAISTRAFPGGGGSRGHQPDHLEGPAQRVIGTPKANASSFAHVDVHRLSAGRADRTLRLLHPGGGWETELPSAHLAEKARVSLCRPTVAVNGIRSAARADHPGQIGTDRPPGDCRPRTAVFSEGLALALFGFGSHGTDAAKPG